MPKPKVKTRRNPLAIIYPNKFDSFDSLHYKSFWYHDDQKVRHSISVYIDSGDVYFYSDFKKGERNAVHDAIINHYGLRVVECPDGDSVVVTIIRAPQPQTETVN